MGKAASDYASEALELFGSIGHLWGMTPSYGRRGFARIGLGDPLGAREDFVELLGLALPGGIGTMVIYGVIGLGAALSATGADDGRAVEVLSSAMHAEGLSASYGRDYVEPTLAALRERVPESEFDLAFESGSEITVTDMAESLLANSSPAPGEAL